MVHRNGQDPDAGRVMQASSRPSGTAARGQAPQRDPGLLARKSAAIELLARQALLRVAHEAHAHGYGLDHIDRSQWARFEQALVRRIHDPQT